MLIWNRRLPISEPLLFLYVVALFLGSMCGVAMGESVIRLSAEGVLREAWSLALVEVKSRDRESYGFLGWHECGYRIEALVHNAIKGPAGSLTILTSDPLEPGRQYLIASRRIRRESIGPDPDPFIACRIRHELHGNHYALVEVKNETIYVADPRGSLVPPGRHPEAPDRDPLPWRRAKSTIEVVLATDGSYPPAESCPDGSKATMRGSQGDGDGSTLRPYEVTYYALCEGIGWYAKVGESASWEFVGNDVPNFLK